jgi:hypothetical protein
MRQGFVPSLLVSACAPAGLFAALLLLPIPGSSQTAKAAADVKKTWTAPRTPWHDPDIQGWFTNTSENGTPLERPDRFAGRKLDDVKGAELAAVKQEVQTRTLKSFSGPLHGADHWWQDDLNLINGAQAWLIVDPPDGKIPPMTSQGKNREATREQARRDSAGHPPASWLDLSLYDRCITRGLPGSMMPAIYGNSFQILQAPGYVAIRYEMVHETRIIPLDGRPHAAGNIRSYMGDARGHWEGDTLIVETTNFRDNSTYRGANAATLRLIERLTRIAPNKVRWSVTVDDPDTWTRPWTFSMPLTVDESQKVLEYSCHEGNYGLRNILSAARAADQKAATGGSK